MVAPLAIIILLMTAIPARAEPCPVPFVAETPDLPEHSAGTRACNYAVSLRPLFEKLRVAADIGSLRLMLSPDNRYNAHFEPGFVVVNLGALAAADAPEEMPFVIAHEIGHAVQHAGPEQIEKLRQVALLSKNPTQAGIAEFNDFKRRHEAQADAIAMELLNKIGHPRKTARRGVEAFTNCSFEAGLKSSYTSRHPTHARRVVNATVGQAFFLDAAKRAQSNNAQDFFERSSARESAAIPLRPRPEGAYSPRAKLDDFRTDGAFLPGRLAAQHKRKSAPPPLLPAPPVQRSIVDIDSYLTVAFIASVNRSAVRDDLAATVLKACGRPEADAVASTLTPTAWSRRATLALSTLSSKPK